MLDMKSQKLTLHPHPHPQQNKTKLKNAQGRKTQGLTMGPGKQNGDWSLGLWKGKRSSRSSLEQSRWETC